MSPVGTIPVSSFRQSLPSFWFFSLSGPPLGFSSYHALVSVSLGFPWFSRLGLSPVFMRFGDRWCFLLWRMFVRCDSRRSTPGLPISLFHIPHLPFFLHMCRKSAGRVSGHLLHLFWETRTQPAAPLVYGKKGLSRIFSPDQGNSFLTLGYGNNGPLRKL